MEQDVEQLDDGPNTMIGPRGTKLSGGQTQRTAAARMFVREPKLLILDDLSSALDVETEQKLWERLSRWTGSLVWLFPIVERFRQSGRNAYAEGSRRMGKNLPSES